MSSQKEKNKKQKKKAEFDIYKAENSDPCVITGHNTNCTQFKW